jgi:gas vesicle protein
MIFRLLLRSEIDAAKRRISDLAIGRQLREGQALVVETGSTAVAAFRFALSAATALAAGFLLSLGLDAMVLIGKWEILVAVAFYAGVIWALVSPILLIPRTVAGAAAALVDANRLAEEAREKTRSAERLQEINRLKATLEAAINDYAKTASYLPNFLRSQVAIDQENNAANQVEELKAKLAQSPSGIFLSRGNQL